MNHLKVVSLEPMGAPCDYPHGDIITKIQFIKRKSDVSRYLFAGCFSPVGTQQDIQKIISSGTTELKSSYRCDHLLENNISMPSKPRQQFNYFCCK